MKQKMSNSQFRSLLLPIVVILVAFVIIASQIATMYAASLDWALGRGERHITGVSDVADEDVTYYRQKYGSAEESQIAASLVAQKVVEEGAVLLKNDNNTLPLSYGDNVTVFGYHYLNPLYVGEGSAAMDTTGDYIVTPEEAFSDVFTLNREVIDKMALSEAQELVYEDENTGTNLYEYDPAIYEGLEDSCQGSTGLVIISRSGLEGFDYNSRQAYADGTETQMQLSTNERNTITYAKENCDKVVVLLNCPSSIEVAELQRDDQIDAILWIGLPGSTGYRAIAGILTGEVNPSGKTSMTWPADLSSDPTYVNRMNTPFTNPIEDGIDGFIEYEEGIYLGYRYYETRYAEDNRFPVFGETGDYDAAVLYPFGYGLNYEDDAVTQTLSSVTENNGTVTVKGTVNNTSSREVKEVVQVYFGAPYEKGGIEKSAKELIVYDKLTVAANSRQDFQLTFALEDMASYDYTGIYSQNGSYVLEAGDYAIYLGKDSHNVWDEKTIKVDETLVYADEAIRGKAVGKRVSDAEVAENRFGTMSQYQQNNGMTQMSRSDFEGTFPQEPVEKPLSEDLVQMITSFDFQTDRLVGDVPGSLIYKETAPASNAENGLILSAMRGLSYDDPRWDLLLDNLDYSSEQISGLITHALYRTAAVDSIGLVETSDHDGTAGLTATWGGNNDLAAMFGMVSLPVVSCAFPCSPVQSATWNQELLREMGEMIGQESLTNQIHGWYAPGVNLQRTPFGGRNFEYYSEDPVLSGYSAAALISGAFEDGGLTAYLKHFVLNESDDNRSGVSVWVNEQALRQLYLKPFELCIKNASGDELYYDVDEKTQKTIHVPACRAIMTAMCYVGAESPTNSYTLLTEITRGEWGFTGMVITDMSSGGTYKNRNFGYRIGNDIWMFFQPEEVKLDTPTTQWAARNAVKNVAYVVVNGNAYNNVKPGAVAYYDESPWHRTLRIINICLLLLSALGVIWMVIRQLDDKKHPEKYVH